MIITSKNTGAAVLGVFLEIKVYFQAFAAAELKEKSFLLIFIKKECII